MGLNAVQLNALLKGPCNVLYADPTDVENPANISDIFDPDGSPYELAEGWSVFGATTAGTAYSRQFSTQGYQIEQQTGNVEEDVTDVVRSVSLTAGQISPEILRIMEQAKEVKTVKPATGRVGEEQVWTGSVETLEQYLVAFVARRFAGHGADVVESGGDTRGGFVVGGLLRAKLTGDQAQLALARGQLAGAPLTLQAYPDTEQPEGEEHGFWFAETAGTIS
jgi:hypothetical protein